MSKRTRSPGNEKDIPRARRPFRQPSPGTTEHTEHTRHQRIGTDEQVLREDHSQWFIGDGMLRARASNSWMDVQERSIPEHPPQPIMHPDVLREARQGDRNETVEPHPPCQNTKVHLHSTPAHAGCSRCGNLPHSPRQPSASIVLPGIETITSTLPPNPGHEQVIRVMIEVPVSRWRSWVENWTQHCAQHPSQPSGFVHVNDHNPAWRPVDGNHRWNEDRRLPPPFSSCRIPFPGQIASHQPLADRQET
ncbi:hypothetical protein DACRYDRAFT_109919 [Dacryopinax primogenitus]|uniref:Uncharacterized protein n=1 Tax=Dacryopinax primogenitus (strain DJM 731) TaxID=1858805 RepID=M5FUP4_DACPD|nr:uncharacterized protein DACRYDRAFT_109919 [Dacryopinax primogenitus]EJT99194.1 hypothetical protein DACRYDRAFT_109919 [Dacryopinax primogenitus]